MTHQRSMFTALLLRAGLTYSLAGCSAVEPADPTIPTSTDDEGEGEGEDYQGGNGDNTSGGPDEDDAGIDVLPTYPTTHPRIYLGANMSRLQASLSAGTQAATRFKATVDRWVAGQSIWGFQVWNAALLGPLTNDPVYCAKAVAAVDANVTAEEAKIVAGQQPVVAQNSYLEVGPVIGDLALTYDWCHDVVSASQKTRWLRYANQAVWNVWNPTQARWGSTPRSWTGWSTNNPSNNYFYSFLRATMLLGLAARGEDPQADAWITQFRDTKVLGQLVPTFDAQLRGGGSREGTAYGVSHRGLFHLYDLWYATTGEKLQAKTRHARQSLRAAMHQVMPTLDRFAPTGDQPRDMTAMFFDYQRNYLQELIDLYPHDPVAARAKALLEQSSLPAMARPEMLVFDFLYDNDGVATLPLDGMATDYHATGIGHVYSRSSWERDATWVNLIAGAYTESHAHQDQGSLMIFKDGWLAADGVLGSQNGIIQDTTSHNLVRLTSGGQTIRQNVNTESSLVSLHRGDGWLHAAADTTAAYGGNAAVQRVQRELVFIKPNTVVVYDRVATSGSTSQIWQLVSPIRPTVSGATATISGSHALRVQRLVPASPATPTTVTDLATVAGYRSGHRLDTTQAGGDRRYLHVLSLDGAVASATAVGDTGVTLQLAGGHTAMVTFERDVIGASLELDGVVTTLGPGVELVPE